MHQNIKTKIKNVVSDFKKKARRAYRILTKTTTHKENILHEIENLDRVTCRLNKIANDTTHFISLYTGKTVHFETDAPPIFSRMTCNNHPPENNPSTESKRTCSIKILEKKQYGFASIEVDGVITSPYMLDPVLLGLIADILKEKYGERK